MTVLRWADEAGLKDKASEVTGSGACPFTSPHPCTACSTRTAAKVLLLREEKDGRGRPPSFPAKAVFWALSFK